MRRVRFSAAARSDLSHIAKWSLSRWGVDQRDRYIAQLHERVRQLRERPLLAPAVGRRRPGLRRLSVGSHIVFYRFDDERVFVVRILDQRMDLDAHLDRSANEF